jgi:hypothetical protein
VQALPHRPPASPAVFCWGNATPRASDAFDNFCPPAVPAVNLVSIPARRRFASQQFTPLHQVIPATCHGMNALNDSMACLKEARKHARRINSSSSPSGIKSGPLLPFSPHPGEYLAPLRCNNSHQKCLRRHPARSSKDTISVLYGNHSAINLITFDKYCHFLATLCKYAGWQQGKICMCSR